MSYKIIERNDLGIRVRNNTEFHDCQICKYSAPRGTCKLWHRCVKNSYYLTDQEAAKLETELTPETFTINDMYVESKLLFDCQDKLNDLQIENKQLKERIEELESEKSTELITKNEGSFYQETITKCCGIGMITKENFCPNCGRKIMR